jgi:hypothetical protein
MWSLAVTQTTASVAILTGSLLSVCDVVTGDGRWTIPAAAICLAGVSTCSVTLQQQARIHLRVDWMILSLFGSVAIPAAWSIKVLTGTNTRWGAALVCCVLAVGALIQTAAIRRSEQPATGWANDRRVLAGIVKVGLPLLPHMFAFGALLQGARLAATLRGGRPNVVAEASSMMLFLGVGFAVIAGIHGLLATSIQRTRTDLLGESLRRFAWAYGLLGLASAVGTVIVVYSPMRTFLDDMPKPSALVGAAMAAAPSALCCYYLLSSLLVRVERTAVLALVTVSVSATYFVVAAVHPWSASNLLLLFAGAASSLHLCALPLVLRYGGVQPRALIAALLVTWIGFIPGLGLALLGVAA